MSDRENSAEPTLRFYEVLGIMTALAFESELHRAWSISDLQANFIPAIILGHCKVYFDRERHPCAFATWALVDDETHLKLLVAASSNDLAVVYLGASAPATGHVCSVLK